MSSVSTATSASTASFKTSLVFNAIVFGAELAAFTILRPRFKAIYEPRAYVPVKSKRCQSMGHGLFAWPLAVWRIDYKTIINANGMDAYFFVRFLRMLVKIFLPIWIISWVVLLPIDSVGTTSNGNTGLNRFILGNIATGDRQRYAAHVILIYIFTAWVLYNVRVEMANFIIERQKYLISPAHAKSVQANSILITAIPAKYLSEKALYHIYKDLPGGVKRIWINHDLKELPGIYNRRTKACNKLESAETKLLSIAAKLKRKAEKKGGPASKTNDSETGGSTATLVPQDKRPSHRLGFLPFTGEKVDTIDWARKEIQECTELLDAARERIDTGLRDQNNLPVDDQGFVQKDDKQPTKPKTDVAKSSKKKKLMSAIPGLGGNSDGNYPPLNSAFILFNRQIAAHMAAQMLTHHEPYRMSDRYIEISPEDVIWGNLGLNPYEINVRIAISWALTIGLIVIWAIPVAFIGALSNVATLTNTYHWLGWINKLPTVVIGIISGILPPVLLAVLMMLLPIILRVFARFEGIPQRTAVELSVMTRFFMFEVIHSFLIVSLSSGIIASLPGIAKDPSSIATLLAQNLPQASIFFLTYIILQGLSGSAGGFLQIVPLAIYYVKLFLLGSTPRSVYNIKYTLRSVSWGTTFPGITLLVVITLGYSIIAPIINGLACATFFMFYMLYKYLFLYQYGQTAASDTGGLFFPKAIQHVFVGLYIEEVCLCALFFLGKAIPEGAVMVVLILLTAGYHHVLNVSYDPILHALPLSLADKTWNGTRANDEHSRKEGNSLELQERNGGDSARPSNAADNQADDNDRTHILEKQNTVDTTSKNDGANVRPVADRKKSTVFEEYGFSHPATSRPQRIIWLPRDDLGLGEEEERACREAGVAASTKDAVMNEKGHVDVSGAPPGDEEEDEEA